MFQQVIKGLEVINNAFRASMFNIYIVGGCCRDLIMDRIPKDWDLTTSAKPNEIESICENYNLIFYPTGKQYGTITVMVNDIPFEITTHRLDSNYEDGRRPTQIVFSDNILDDLARRDFRMNAIAIELNSYLQSDFIKDNIISLIIDPYDGLRDINNKEINCVGDPSERFKEDGLRIMRAIRFAIKYDFKIGSETLNALYENHNCLNKISYERIQNEFNQIILNFNLDVNDLCDEKYLNEWKIICFIVKKIFPEMYELSNHTHNSIYHIYDIFTHSMLVCAKTDTSNIATKLAALFHDVGKIDTVINDDKYLVKHFYGHAKRSTEITAAILKRFKYSNEIIEDVLTMILYHDTELQNNKKSIKRLLNKVGENLFKELLSIKLADKYNHLGYTVNEEYTIREEILKTYKEILDEKEVFSIKDLAIAGDDLINLGYEPSSLFKEILNDCLNVCIEKPECNTKEYLLEYIYEKY